MASHETDLGDTIFAHLNSLANGSDRRDAVCNYLFEAAE